MPLNYHTSSLFSHYTIEHSADTACVLAMYNVYKYLIVLEFENNALKVMNKNIYSKFSFSDYNVLTSYLRQ